MGVRYNPSVITNGLQLYLDAGNRKSYLGSGTTWVDISGNNRNGTLVNSPTFNSANGGSISFDGTNDYVDGIGGAITSTTQISVCLWNNGQVAKPSAACWFTDVANGYDRICSTHLPWVDNIVYFDCGANATTNFDRISKSVTNAEYQGWHYWVFTKNTTTGNMRIYLDGNLWHSGSSLTQPLRLCDTGRIGTATFSGITHYHQGNIASFSVYNRELSAQEILQNFNATRSRFGI